MVAGESMNKNLPFWDDDLDLFCYLPEYMLISLEDAYQKYGLTPTDITKCRAWWNTNLPMDNFIPSMVPCDPVTPGAKICLLNFVERVEQRVNGEMHPIPPELIVKPGIIILDKELKNFVGCYFNHPESNEIQVIIMNEGKLIIEKSFSEGEVVQRDTNKLYWDMYERKYV